MLKPVPPKKLKVVRKRRINLERDAPFLDEKPQTNDVWARATRVKKSFLPDGRVVRAVSMKPWERSVLRASLNQKKRTRQGQAPLRGPNESWRGQRVIHPSHGPMRLIGYKGNNTFEAIGRGDNRYVVNRDNVKFTRRKK